MADSVVYSTIPNINSVTWFYVWFDRDTNRYVNVHDYSDRDPHLRDALLL